MDRVGTLLVPGVLLLGQALTVGRVVFMFGWAKPVPVLRWPSAIRASGMMLVAAAGPAMNFFLAWLAALAMHPAGRRAGRCRPAIWSDVLCRCSSCPIWCSGLFNLLPIPPLDGGRIVGRVAAAAAGARL